MIYENNEFQDKRLPVGASALLKLEGKLPFSLYPNDYHIPIHNQSIPRSATGLWI